MAGEIAVEVSHGLAQTAYGMDMYSTHLPDELQYQTPCGSIQVDGAVHVVLPYLAGVV